MEKKVDLLIALGNLVMTIAIGMGASIYIDFLNDLEKIKGQLFWGNVGFMTVVATIGGVLFYRANELIESNKNDDNKL